MPLPNTTITIAGGKLMKIAAQIYGDPTQWNRIAAENGRLQSEIARAHRTGMVHRGLPQARMRLREASARWPTGLQFRSLAVC
jgi:hypothetical protein